jgi:hypothetical protein
MNNLKDLYFRSGTLRKSKQGEYNYLNLLRNALRIIGVFSNTEQLPSGQNVVFNQSSGKWVNITLSSNIDFSFGELEDNSSGLIFIQQDSTGGHTINWVNALAPIGGITISSNPNTASIVGYVYSNGVVYLDNKNYGVPPSTSTTTTTTTSTTQVPTTTTTTTSGDVMIPLTFSTNVGLVNNSGIWGGTSAVGDFDNIGLDSRKIASGTNGFIQVQMKADSAGTVIGFNLTNANEPYTSYEYALYLTPSIVYTIINGSLGNYGAPVIDNYYRLVRTGSQIKLQTSPTSGPSGFWTDVTVVGAPSSADLFIAISIDEKNGDGKCYYPLGYNIV